MKFLIRVAACGICGTDIKKIHHVDFVKPPQILGHEVAGTVVAVGREVTRWKAGDRVEVFITSHAGIVFAVRAEIIFAMRRIQEKLDSMAGFDPNGGGFAQFVRAMPWVAERGMVAIPDNISFERSDVHRAG